LTLLEHHGVSKTVRDALLTHPKDVLLPGLTPIPIVATRSGTLISLDQKRLGGLVNHALSSRADGGKDLRAGIHLSIGLKDAVHNGDTVALVFSDIPKDAYYQEVLSCFEIS
jgi:thymidine phosphorylase